MKIDSPPRSLGTFFLPTSIRDGKKTLKQTRLNLFSLFATCAIPPQIFPDETLHSRVAIEGKGGEGETTGRRVRHLLTVYHGLHTATRPRTYTSYCCLRAAAVVLAYLRHVRARTRRARTTQARGPAAAAGLVPHGTAAIPSTIYLRSPGVVAAVAVTVAVARHATAEVKGC